MAMFVPPGLNENDLRLYLHFNISGFPDDSAGKESACNASIKDRNGMDLTEAEDIKKRWQEYTEELYKKDLHDQIITMV